MKLRLLLSLALFPVFTYAQDVRTIVCHDQSLQTEVLRFSSIEGQKTYQSDNYSLQVEIRGDDIAKMTLLDNQAKLFLFAHRMEDLLITSGSLDGSETLTVTAPTRKGSAQSSLQLNSLSAQVDSYERKGQSSMSLIVTSPVAYSLSCKSIR